MKYLLPVLLAASLAAAAPALADNDHGRGDGGWHGGGRGDGGTWRGGRSEGGSPRGEPAGEPRGNGNGNGGGNGRGGRWVGPGGAPEGRWNGGYPGSEGGQVYAAPPRGRQGPVPEYYSGEQDEARRGVRSGQIRPMGEIVSRLERARPGRMLDANLEPGPNGRPAYRVIWGAADGRRIDYLIDAQTGAILQGR